MDPRAERAQRGRAYFDQLPYRDGLAQQLLQLRGEESARYSGFQERQGRLFAMRFKPPAQQPVLVRLSSVNPPALWRPVFDPNVVNSNGATTIDWYVPSPDGRRVAICLSDGGSEQGTLHFFEVDSGTEIGEGHPTSAIPHRRRRGFVERRRVRPSSTPGIRVRASVPRPTWLSSNRSGRTVSVHPWRTTSWSSARTFPGSPRSSWRPASTAAGFASRWPTR